MKTLPTCDTCGSAESKHYLVECGGRVASANLCVEHGLPLEQILGDTKPVELPPVTIVSRGRRIRVPHHEAQIITMEDFAQRRRNSDV